MGGRTGVKTRAPSWHAPCLTGQARSRSRGQQKVVRAAIPLLVVLGAVRAAFAAPCTLNDVCGPGGGPCTLNVNRECDSPLTLDLVGRDLVIAQGKALRVTRGDGAGLLQVKAASVSLQKDALIKAEGDQGDSGFVVIESTGPVTLAPDSKGIDVSATLDGGFLQIEAASGNLEALGPIQAKAGRDGEGGEVILAAKEGNVTVGAGGINASASGELSGGGAVELTAAGDVSVLGFVDISGGEAGELDADAGGSIATGAGGDIAGSATEPGGGASFTFVAGGDVSLAGQITATAPGNDEWGGGAGGDIEIIAETGNVEIGAQLDVRGSKPDGDGGFLDVTAGLDLTVSAPIQAGIDGGGFGGAVTLWAGGRTSIASILDVRADDHGGSIDIEAGDALTIQGTLLADATGDQSTGGRTTLRACTLLVVREAVVSATGGGLFPDASNQLQVSGEMTVSGMLTASDRNVLVYRDTPPAIGSGAVIAPEEDVVQDATLPCCGDACTPPTTTTTVTTRSTTSTSTTAPAGASTTTTSTTTPEAGPTSTSSTAPATPPTTPPTTLPPASCLDAPLAGFDVVDCYLDVLSDALSRESPDALGGPKLAHKLSARISQAQRLVTIARANAKPAATLRRARKQLRGFRSAALRGKRQRKIGAAIVEHLLALADQASATVDDLRASAGR
jgi:hypothetical protein